MSFAPVLQPQPARRQTSIPRKRGGGAWVIVQDALEAPPGSPPDVVLANPARSYSDARMGRLLTALNSLRAAAPDRFFYLWIENRERDGNGEIFLMASSDGVAFAPVTQQRSTEAFLEWCAGAGEKNRG